MRIRRIAAVLLLAACAFPATAAKSKKKPAEPSPLDRFALEAARQSLGLAAAATPGSIYVVGSPYADLGRDLKASQVNDIVTIVVSESASAVSTGATKTARKTAANASISSLAGVSKATGALANLANLGGSNSIDGSGTTSRQTTLSTTLTARVTGVLPNGYLVLEGTKDVEINSERQIVTVRGVIRPADLATDNSVPSNRLAQMEIHLNGKGVVGDSIRRPFILYRLLLGILPF